MKKYIVEHEFDGYEIGTYLKETKGYSSRGLRNLEIYLNGKRIKNNAKKNSNEPIFKEAGLILNVNPKIKSFNFEGFFSLPL